MDDVVTITTKPHKIIKDIICSVSVFMMHYDNSFVR